MTDSVLGLDASDQSKKITINKKDRFEQLYIIGSTRQGKTTLIENLVLEDIKNDLGVCLIDPHGDLINGIISRMTKRLEDVVYIDLGDKTYVAPFNLFHCEDTTDDHAVENVVSAFLHILQSSFGISPDQHARMNQYFRHIATLLVYNQNHTMLDILQLLTDDGFMLQLVENVPDHWEKTFWKDFYAKYSKGMRRMEDISMISNKIEEFISPVMRPWFGDTKKTIHFRKLMDERKIVLIKSNPEWETITKIVGNVVIAQLLDAAYSRRDIPLNNRKQMNVYVDEYAKFASEDFSKLFSEAAKYGLSMSITQQVLEQVDPAIKAVCSQAKNVAVFRVSPENGKELASVFDCSPRPGLPHHEPLKTPVREPIQFILTHGVHPRDEIERFIKQYGKMMVESVVAEKYLERDSKREFQRYEHDLTMEKLRDEYNSQIIPHSNMRPLVGFAVPPSIQVSYDWRNLLDSLNDLFYQAMWFGKLGRDITTIPIPLSFLEGFLKIFGEDKGYLSFQSNYENVAKKVGIRVIDAEGYGKKIERLQKLLDNLHFYRQNEINELCRKKDAVEKEWRRVGIQRNHIAATIGEENMNYDLVTIIGEENKYYGPIKPWWGRLRFVTLFDEQLDIFKEEDYKIFSYEVVFLEKILCELRPWRECSRGLNDGQFAVIKEATERLQSIKGGYVRLVDMSEYLDVYGDMRIYLEKWVIFERAKKALMDELGLLSQQVDKIVAPKSEIAWENQNWMSPLRVARPKEFSSLVEGIKVLKEEIKKDRESVEQMIHAEIKMLTSLENGKDGYDTAVSNLELQLRMAMQAFAVAPVEADSGLTKEVPTEILTPEVESRIANEIKQLPKHTARVKLTSGEYTIKTIEPKGHISESALQKRIIEIQERNRKYGYLRLRSEVKEEIRKRYGPPDPPPPPAPQGGAGKNPSPQKPQQVATPVAAGAKQPVQPVALPPQVVPTPRKVTVKNKQCPNQRCGANNDAAAKFCNQCGTQL